MIVIYEDFITGHFIYIPLYQLTFLTPLPKEKTYFESVSTYHS